MYRKYEEGDKGKEGKDEKGDGVNGSVLRFLIESVKGENKNFKIQS